MMKECRVLLAEINMIDSSDVGKKHDDLERIHRALNGVSDLKNSKIEKLIREMYQYSLLRNLM